MRGLLGAFRELPAGWRWAGLAGGGILLSALLAGIVWYGLGWRHQAGLEAFATPSALYRQALTAPPESDPAEAVRALRDFLAAHPRHQAAAEAWYYLGNLLYRKGAHDEALQAFGEATRRGEGLIVTLSRLGSGYAWEAKGDYSRALGAYQAGLKAARPGSYLYGEFLLGTARSQEQLKQAGEAAASYRRFLKELPKSLWADAVKSRLAHLEPAPAAK